MSALNDSILSLINAYKAAVLAKDVEAFVDLYDRDARIFDLWAKWSYDSADTWRAMVAQWFASLGTETDAVDFNDIQAIVTDELAGVSAFVTFRRLAVDGRELRSMQERLTWSLRRTEGAWKIVHQHTSAPVDFATFKVIFERN